MKTKQEEIDVCASATIKLIFLSKHKLNLSLTFHRGQTSEAFFVLFSGILFNVKWKHG